MKTAIETKCSMIRSRLLDLVTRYERTGYRGIEPMLNFRALAELTASLHHLAEDSKQSLERSKLYLIGKGAWQDSIDAVLYRATADSVAFMQKMASATSNAIQLEEEDEPTDPGTGPTIQGI